MTTTTMKFTKIEAGWYATEDGRYAVIVDGYKPSKSIDSIPGGYEGFKGGEWASVFDGQGRMRNDHQAAARNTAM